MTILFDSARCVKPATFGRGVDRRIPKITGFEPSPEDREWAAREFAADVDVSAQLQDIANRAAKVIPRQVERGAARQRRAQILNVRALVVPPVSGGAPVQPSTSDWTDYSTWSARLEEIYGGVDYEPRSSRISDEDIAILHAVG